MVEEQKPASSVRSQPSRTICFRQRYRVLPIDRLAAGRRRLGKIFARGQALRTYKVNRPVKREVLILYNAML